MVVLERVVGGRRKRGVWERGLVVIFGDGRGS